MDEGTGREERGQPALEVDELAEAIRADMEAGVREQGGDGAGDAAQDVLFERRRRYGWRDRQRELPGQLAVMPVAQGQQLDQRARSGFVLAKNVTSLAFTYLARDQKSVSSAGTNVAVALSATRQPAV